MKIEVNKEVDSRDGTKYFTVSGKNGSRQIYRMGHFLKQKEAEAFGKEVLQASIAPPKPLEGDQDEDTK